MGRKTTRAKDTPRLETIPEDKELAAPLIHAAQICLVNTSTSAASGGPQNDSAAYLSWIGHVFPCLFDGDEDVCTFRL
jgi:hypothetical protein